MAGTEPLPHVHRAGWRFAAGFVLAAVLLLGLAEGFLRFFPPRDLHPYLGDQSPAAGILAPHPDFVATYRSWDEFCRDNARRLQPYLPFREPDSGPPIWAMFGNSFIHAPGMLADTAREKVRDRVIFNLGRNEAIVVRFSQIELLLEHGLKPERIFIELMPIDVVGLCDQPLPTLRVNSHGALVYEPEYPPGAAGTAVRESRLAFTAWCRTGRQRGGRNYRHFPLHSRVPESLVRDVEHLFAALERVTKPHGVPVTVIFIPTYQQVLQGSPCGFQDTLAPILRRHGCDILDPRNAFLRHPDRPGLFLPDKHLTLEGNRILLEELLAHVGHEPTRHARKS